MTVPERGRLAASGQSLLGIGTHALEPPEAQLARGFYFLTQEMDADERLQPGRIYVAPGGRHMGLGGSRQDVTIRLHDGPVVNFCRPAVDVLFQDAATIFGASALAVVLTGMGSDGTGGARALAEAGAAVLAQDEATSTVWGMPGSIAKAGLAQAILPLAEIGPALRNLLTGQGA